MVPGEAVGARRVDIEPFAVPCGSGSVGVEAERTPRQWLDRARGRVGGRPTVWTPEKLRTARAMFESGEHDVATIARVLGVSRASVYRALSKAV